MRLDRGAHQRFQQRYVAVRPQAGPDLVTAGREADSAALGGKHAQRRPITQPHECPVGEGRGVASERFHGSHH